MRRCEVACIVSVRERVKLRRSECQTWIVIQMRVMISGESQRYVNENCRGYLVNEKDVAARLREGNCLSGWRGFKRDAPNFGGRQSDDQARTHRLNVRSFLSTSLPLPHRISGIETTR